MSTGLQREGTGNPTHQRIRPQDAATNIWYHVLLGLLGVFELLMALSAGPVLTIVVGIVGALALLAAPWTGGSSLGGTAIRRVAIPLLLLVIGTVPFAVLTWWSVASPLLAVVALGLGIGLFRSRSSRS